jgi:two-component system chemotaxis response regulator CheY
MACILVIDDDVAVRSILGRMLARAGYTVVEAGDTHAGLAALQAHPIDLVITDIVMPGSGGYQVIRMVKTLRPQAKVLAISGGRVFTARDMLESAAAVGADWTLAKPVAQAELLEAVQTLLAEE